MDKEFWGSLFGVLIAICIIVSAIVWNSGSGKLNEAEVSRASNIESEMFTYYEHSYIFFKIESNGRLHSGIIHNPDCEKCKQ